ncbi:MAG: nitroreductase family protein [Bacteroidales bacterium]|nr:nitroreductase family protein [Bacteroidales bacterium]
MTLQEAIVARHSVRQYMEKPIEAEKIEELKALIDECNREGGTHLQLVTDEPKAFAGGMAKYGKFSGISNYIAVVGKKGADTLLGYYGEKVVIRAQMLGLSTCWVGLSFSKQPDSYQVLDGEKLFCVISLGYGANQGVQHKLKPIENFAEVNGAMPEWFRQGVEAAILAPTAVNQQKFKFVLRDGNRVEAKAKFSLIGYAQLDLGIARYHFEVGAGKENFEWA